MDQAGREQPVSLQGTLGTNEAHLSSVGSGREEWQASSHELYTQTALQ